MVDGITKGVLVSLCCDTAKAKVGITVEQVVVFFATLVYNPYLSLIHISEPTRR